MNILQIIHCFPPESMTGSEIYAYNLSKELSKNHEVSVFYRVNKPAEEEYKVTRGNYNGLKVYKINNTLKGYNSLEKIYKNKDIESRFLQVLDEVRPDIVHIHHLLFLSMGIIYELKRRNIPIVFTLHDYWMVCPRGQLIKHNTEICNDPKKANCLYCLAAGLRPGNLIKRLFTFPLTGRPSKRFNIDLQKVSGSVDLFISPSQFLRRRFIEFGIPPEKIIYSDNGMEPGLFKDIEKTISDKIRFGFIGTLIPSKGVHILIKAFNQTKRNRAVLKIYGKSPLNNGIWNYYGKIKRMAKHNKDIKFMGTFENKDAAEIFKEIDVLVFPSIWHENSPLTIHEAIMTRTPVIASDIGGLGELVRDKKNGFLFERGNVKELYDKMTALIENKNMLKVFDFNSSPIKDIKKNAEEMEEIYSQLCTRQ